MRKKLRQISETLEFERVTRGVSQEHCSLFAHLSFKSDARGDEKVALGRLKPVRQRLPVLHRQDHSEVTRRNAVTIHRVGVGRSQIVIDEVQRYLVAQEVQIDPALVGAACAHAERAAVEVSCYLEIVNRKREVERPQFSRHRLRPASRVA